ncbi:MAG TPA: carboxypeptidase-like regulatory domain-containing protein, partial [Pyrinomonadaceae bacterium]|nr:carboxypeptidase-like regulatory domain-containing protein [Pyrinomonadaceae bacterium]
MLRVPLTLAILLSIAMSINAQSQANTGNIEGRVTDPNAASVPNVTVTATNLATGLQKNAQTNDEGIYRIVFLPPGAYKVETSGAQGFTPATFTNVIVTVGGQTPLDIQLAVGNATVAMVDVSAEGQVVETTRTSVSSVVNERAIQNLPVNGRNFLDFATLTPSVVRDPTRQGDLAVGG